MVDRHVDRLGGDQRLGEPGPQRHVEHLVDPRLAQVGVDEHHLCPAWASTTARLVAVVVLPSPGSELVTWMTRSGLSSPRNCTLVRSPRYTSTANSCGSLSAIGRLSGGGSTGTTASTGSPVSRLDVLGAPQRVVEVVDEERRAEPEQQADDAGEHGRAQRRRLDRIGRQVGRLHDRRARPSSARRRSAAGRAAP